MRSFFIFIAFFVSTVSLYAQAVPALGKYWVEFTDKNNTKFCTCRPAEFLSARAIERRAKAGIEIVENDLPVNPDYLGALQSGGAKIHGTSKWLNAASIIADSATAFGLASFPFVKKVEYIGRNLAIRHKPNRPLKKRQPLPALPTIEGNDKENLLGYAFRQTNVLDMVPLNLMGIKGRGMLIAVMDGGFTHVDTLPFFDSLALQNRLFSAWDFVERDKYVFEGADHGTSVLSTMAANLPGYFVGTAPDATYLCLKTEDTGGEYPIEEANWIAGAEFADSIGADIINASLGYTGFNDKKLSHTFAQLDGRTAIGSRGATIAAQKGMIICNSIGNSGNEEWRYLGVPSDAPGVIAVGAVDYEAKKADFSSFGPTADGRIKPDLVAPGEMLITAGNKGIELGFSSGTSVASPILVGAIASLWSDFPDLTAKEILEAVYASADQNLAPDNERGYGLPDFFKAWLTLKGFQHTGKSNNARNGLFAFDAKTGTLDLLSSEIYVEKPLDAYLRSVTGKIYKPQKIELKNDIFSHISLTGLGQLPAGTYQVVLINPRKASRFLSLRL